MEPTSTTADFPEWSRCPASLLGAVTSAVYGAEGGRWADVRSAVARAAAEGRDVEVTNDFLGCDPVPGVCKTLRIVYEPRLAADGRPLVAAERPMGGFSAHPERAMVEAWEGSRVELPAGTVGGVPGACYGAEGAWVDVRGIVERYASHDGSLSIPVSNTVLGGDPAPGRLKSLRVTYTAHESRVNIADLGEWEVYEDFVVEGINGCQGSPGVTLEDLAQSRRRCLLLGCGGFWLSRGTVNQFGDEDSPPGCNMLRATQEEIRAAMRSRPRDRNASSRNRALRPGVHIAPREFVADATWRPGMDPAPAPHVSWMPTGRYCAFATQVRVPAEGVAEATFYMCGGFFCGYCGIQQHAGEGQTILFSVWNAASGGRAEALEGGPGVVLSCFGGEGMGAKGSLDYPPETGACWLPDTPYTFLVRAEPDGGDATVFSCHFFKPEEGCWRLLARIRRPDPQSPVQGRLGNPGGFLEDFCHTGARRSGEWGPTWVQRAEGTWDPVVRVKVEDGCGRPNKAAHLTQCQERLVLLAGGDALDPGSVLFDGHVKAAPPAECLTSAPGSLPSGGWAVEPERAACGRPVVQCLEDQDGQRGFLVELKEWETMEPLGATLLAAAWGVGSVWVDVRQQVDAALSAGATLQVRNETLGGDPCPGDLKYLRVLYSLG